MLLDRAVVHAYCTQLHGLVMNYERGTQSLLDDAVVHVYVCQFHGPVMNYGEGNDAT